MEDQEVKSSSNFPVKKFFFLQTQWKYEDRSAFKITLRSCSEARLQNFEQFFTFKWISSPLLEWQFIAIELRFAFLLFGSLYLGILGFSLFALFKYCLESYLATTELLKKELSSY